MKILRVHADQSELVEFGHGEPRPGGPGFADDGYVYEPTGNPDQFTRRIRPVRVADGTTEPVVAAVEQVRTANPAATVAELSAQAHASLDGQHGPGLVDQALGVVIDRRYQRAIRFADSPDQLVPKGAGPFQPWPQAFANQGTRTAILKRAALHVDGKQLDDTPFVSVACSEGQFLLNAEVSVCAVIFGSTATGQLRQAQRIFQLVIPLEALITPAKLLELGLVSPAVAQMTSKESEALFYGFGVATYVVGSRPNPYSRADQAPLQQTAEMLQEQQTLEQEEIARQAALAHAPTVGTFSAAAAAGQWTVFGPQLQTFLETNKVAITTRCRFPLEGSNWEALFGRGTTRKLVLNKLDEALSNDATLAPQWRTLTQQFRT